MAKVKKEVTKEESQKALDIMADERFHTEFSTLLKTRYPLFFVTTNEERRLLCFLDHFARVKGYTCFIWDCFRGLLDLDSGEVVGGIDETIKDPLPILEHILNEGKNYLNNKEAVEKKREEGTRGIIYVLLDYCRFIEENPDVERRLKAISNLEGIVSTIITGPTYKSTSTLENLIPVLDFPFPNREEIRTALWELVDSVSAKIPAITDKTKKQEEELINSVSGLTLMEAQTAFAKSIVCNKGWNIPTILQEKRQIINKSGILEYYDNVASLSDVGGLKNLINWIKSRKDCFSSQAEAYGLNKPRGLLTLGLPGTGKSLVCKAISGAWGMPLLRLDFGKLFDSLVGQSEARARDALRLAESIAPSILWIDEIEKGLSGVQSSGRSDGGTTARVLSTFLTWMQEKTAPVFVVATANDHGSIPAEFLRAGRFDEIFFVDLPNEVERKEIFSILLRKRKLQVKDFNLDLLSAKSVSGDYSGAEIEKGIDNAMLVGFQDKRRKIKDDDIRRALAGFKPLYVMRNEDFADIREWAEERCRPANEKDKGSVDLGLKNSKKLDLE